jgi:hypothetical protein
MSERIQRKPIYVYNRDRQTFLATHATMKTGIIAWLFGLCGKTKRWAQLGSGLWIVACRFAHTVGVTFPIDVIFLNQENRVVCVEEHVRPFRVVRAARNVSSVLELPPHTIYRSGTVVGDRFEIRHTR